MSAQRLAGAPIVLVTDYQWPDIEIERAVLATTGARVVVSPDSSSQQLSALACDASAIMTCWAKVTSGVLESAPACVVVARAGVGLDNIDVERATDLGIVVTNVPDYCVDDVAEHTMALVLASIRRVCEFDQHTRTGTWDNKAAGRIHRVRGQTLGLVGYGRVARAVATLARAFGMTIATYSPRLPDRAEPRPDIRCQSLPELLSLSDVVSLHAPLSAGTAGMVGAAELAQMKPDAFLVNTARGGLIDFAALEQALDSGTIRGAALDVLAGEPPSPDQIRGPRPHLILTPHAAFYSDESLAELERRTAEIIRDCLRGEIPPNVANPSVLDSPRLRLGRL